jgi:REP element-mobilizing transposase RayT
MQNAQHEEPTKPHRGWHSRGYLPHFDQPCLIQSVTIRLADSLPASLREQWESDGDERERSRRIEQVLDRGYGASHLRHPKVAELVENALLHFDGERYRMLAWVLMPNHVHCVFEMMDGFPLSGLLHSWKSFTAHEAAKLVAFEAPFWWEDYYDRYMRDIRHYEATVRYIHRNPCAAGLCAEPHDWRWSSARRGEMPTLSKVIMPDGRFRERDDGEESGLRSGRDARGPAEMVTL